MNVDILLCIDGTGSMSKIIEDVKNNISRFVNNLIKHFSNKHLHVDAYRIKIIVFRNIDVDGENWLQETPFYNMGKSQVKLNNFLSSIVASGGSPKTPYEDSLSALSIGLSNSNWSFNSDDIQIIGLWTDEQSKEIGHKLKTYSKRYKNYVPSSYLELKNFWTDLFLSKAPNARLLLFAPDKSPWDRILKEWPQTIHYRSDAAGIDHKSPESFLIKNLLVDLTPSVEDANYEKTIEKVKKKENNHHEFKSIKSVFGRFLSFLKKNIKIALITGAVLSGSLISARLIGFSIFSFNLYYTKEINNANTEEFKQRLEEITEILKTQGILNESTEINFNSEIKTRHGWFYDDYDLVLKYSVELSIDNYELGHYTISEIRETMAAAEIITNHLNLVEVSYSHNGPIDVMVIGETDATPITGTITYNGEYGKILLTSYNYDNKLYEIKLIEGDTIYDNVELGVLRASELWQYVKSYTNIFIPKQTFLDLKVITHDNFGGLYRRSTIIVKLYDLNKLE